MVSQDGIGMIGPHAEHDRQKDVHVGQPLLNKHSFGRILTADKKELSLSRRHKTWHVWGALQSLGSPTSLKTFWWYAGFRGHGPRKSKHQSRVWPDTMAKYSDAHLPVTAAAVLPRQKLHRLEAQSQTKELEASFRRNTKCKPFQEADALQHRDRALIG